MIGLLEEKIASDSLDEFKELLHTFSNWRGEILNYFEYRITNGFVERKNDCIKTIKRMSYSYRNTGNFRMRILATNLGCEGRVSTPHSSAWPPYFAGTCAPNQPLLAISFTASQGNSFFRTHFSPIGISISSVTFFASSASFFWASFHHG